MRSYLVSSGFERLIWKDDYSQQEQGTAKWGVRDDITFRTLYDEITKATSDAPMLIGYSTLSTHEPWDVPVNKLQDEQKNAFAYLDDCIGHFVDRLKQTPQWHNLLIIMTADHSISYRQIDETHPERNRIPMLWIGGAVKAPRRIGTYCNQTDLCATLLGQMALPHDDYTYSRDVLSSNYRHPFAIHMYNNGFSMADSTGFMVYDLTANRMTVNQSGDAQRLIERGKAILQTTADDLNKR